MLDQYIKGNVNRISPEAPIPVLSLKDKSQMLGGAGNVYRNLCSMGAETYFISVIGNDSSGKILLKLASNISRKNSYIYIEEKRKTTVKTRYLSNNQQLLRVDQEDENELTTKAKNYILSTVKKLIPKCDAVIISDYNKGVIDKNIAKTIIKYGRKINKPIIVDPKNSDFSIYSNSTLVTPNRNEAFNITKMATNSNKEVELCAKKIIDKYNIKNILITRGEKGLSFINKTKRLHLKTEAREIYDVSGAGDTVLAAFSISYILKMSFEESLNLANIAAGIVVGKLGTATVSKEEIKENLLNNKEVKKVSKLINVSRIREITTKWRKKGLKIGFTNGCFDLIHPGHIYLLSETKKLCDKLIVAVNSDSSIKKIKGENRPIQNQLARTKILDAIESCDKICLFEEKTPLKLIKLIRPDILTKGSDYQKHEIIGLREVESWRGKVVVIKKIKGESTSNIITKSKK